MFIYIYIYIYTHIHIYIYMYILSQVPGTLCMTARVAAPALGV